MQELHNDIQYYTDISFPSLIYSNLNKKEPALFELLIPAFIVNNMTEYFELYLRKLFCLCILA